MQTTDRCDVVDLRERWVAWFHVRKRRPVCLRLGEQSQSPGTSIHPRCDPGVLSMDSEKGGETVNSISAF